MSNKNVYVVNWLHHDDAHVLWLEKQPEIQAESNELEAAKDCLCELICDHLGDSEACLELKPVNYLDLAEWYALRPIEQAGLSNEPHSIFTKGRCNGCGYPLGERNEVLLNSANKLKNGVGFFSNTRPYINYYSEALLTQLTNLFGTVFNTRPILYKGEPTGYVEILNAPDVHYQLHKGVKADSKLRTTFKCRQCHRASFANSEEEALAVEALKPNSVNFVRLSALNTLMLVLDSKAVQQINQKLRLHRFSAVPVQVMPEEQLYIPTDLPEVEHINWR
ncbi:hypothetical protein ORJ00_01310 [Rheinheimera baltica]|uniref:hypothetical protein n=1 Tax=Rheinheimera baltica TaxID=67576 RepID=UPI00273D0CFA|nr:hypothetical protein [Rheinheimera baltica]MDP5141376.1 hypothetical protein [Rheinheimera baltica]